jgi:nitroreductase
VLDLSIDELLTTTRAVRLRLDLDRPVEREVVEDCLRLAHQAPTASNAQHHHFVVVTDPEPRAALARLWASVARPYIARRAEEASRSGDARSARIGHGVLHLADHLHEVPVHVVPCIAGRTERAGIAQQAAAWGSILPGTWSFMLAARSRGLGTAWTTFHLQHEREAAEILGIPYEQVMQAALIPVAYTKGTDFRPAPRKELEAVVHWNGW